MAKHTIYKNLAFQLDEKLLYKLNRNLDINDDKSNVLVSFQVELEGNLPISFHDKNTQLGEKRLELDLSFTNYKILSHEPATSTSNEKIILEIPWTNIEESSKYFYGGFLPITAYYKIGVNKQEQLRTTVYNSDGSIFSQSISLTSNRYQNLENLTFIDEICGNNLPIITGGSFSGCLPREQVMGNSLDVAQVSNFKIGSKNAQVDCTIKSVKMKVLTDLTFDQVSSKGGEINTTQAFTYLLYDNSGSGGGFSESDFRFMSASETQNLCYSIVFPSLVVLTGQMITPSSPHVTYVNGNEIWIRAEEIHVHGPLTVQPGHKLILNVLEGAGGVRFNPGVTVNPDVRISWFNDEDKFKLFPGKTTKEATHEQVNDFCSNNNEYKANKAAAAVIPKEMGEHTEDVIEGKYIVEQIQNTDIPNPSRLYPNPTNGYFMITFERILDADAHLNISDLSGRTVQTEKLSKGSSGFQILGKNLSSGIYFVTITQNGNRTTHKVVVNQE